MGVKGSNQEPYIAIGIQKEAYEAFLRISNEPEEEERRKKNILASYVPACSPRAAQALRSDQNF